MTKYSRSFLVIALFCSLSSLALNIAPARVSSAHPLHPKATPDHPRLKKIEFKSALLGKPMPYEVLLPGGYFAASGTAPKTNQYPVLYLLHGWGGHNDQLTTLTKLTDYAAQYQMIIVMPEGDVGWYTDSATIPKEKYESYILEELIPDVERRFRALKRRAGRSIAGLSMGGYGALKFGVKHPSKFVFVASMSGAVNATSWTQADLIVFGAVGNAIWNDVLKAFGPVGSPTREANDLNNLYGERRPTLSTAGLPFVYLDCGTEDLLLPANRSLADLLLAHSIPHEFRELPGKHDAAYWDRQVQEVLRIADRKMRAP